MRIASHDPLFRVAFIFSNKCTILTYISCNPFFCIQYECTNCEHEDNNGPDVKEFMKNI